MHRPQIYRNGIPASKKGFIDGQTFRSESGQFFTVRMHKNGPTDFIDGKGFGGKILFKTACAYRRQAVWASCFDLPDMIARRKRGKGKTIRPPIEYCW